MCTLNRNDFVYSLVAKLFIRWTQVSIHHLVTLFLFRCTYPFVSFFLSIHFCFTFTIYLVPQVYKTDTVLNIAYWYNTVPNFLKYQFGIRENRFCLLMDQYAWPNRANPLQSVWSMTLTAMMVECEWLIYLYMCTNQMVELQITAASQTRTFVCSIINMCPHNQTKVYTRCQQRSAFETINTAFSKM